MADIITAMDARMGLETPQVVLSWTLDASARAWRTWMLRRGDESWPATETDGLLVDQGPAASLPNGWGDRFAQPDSVHFYSLFCEILRRPESTRDARFRSARLGAVMSLWAPDAAYVWVLTYERGLAVVRRYVRADELCDIKYEINLGEPVRGLAWVGAYGADPDLIAVVTSTRYVEVTSTGQTLREFSLTGLSGTPDVQDVVWEMVAGVRQSIAVLDGRGRRVITYDDTGNILETHDLSSAIPEAGDLATVVWHETDSEFGVGHGRRIVFYDRTKAQSPGGALHHDTRAADYSDILAQAAAFVEGGGTAWVVTDGSELLALSGETAKYAVFATTGWTERYVVDGEALSPYNTFVLARGADLANNIATGSAWTATDSLSAGDTRIDSQASIGLAQGAYIEFSGDVSGWVLDTGTVECWAKLAPSLVGGDALARVLWALEGSVAGNEMVVTLTTTGKVAVDAQFDGTAISLSSPTAIPDSEWHHIAVIFDRSGAGTLRLYIDGVEVASDTSGPWGWGGVIDRGHIATDDTGAAAAPAARPTWVGSIDEFRLVPTDLPILTPVYDWKLQQWAESRTGSEYLPERYSHRDDLFQRMIPPYVQTRDQSSELQLTGPTQLDNGEQVHLTMLGDGSQRTLPTTRTERWWALLGALMDRVHDEADNLSRARALQSRSLTSDLNLLVTHYDLHVELQDLTDPEFTDALPADARVRILRSLILLAQRKGSLDALERIVRLLGFAVLLSESFPRRHLDSTRDPTREDVPFDSANWGLDSGAPTQPAANVDVRFFRIRAPLVSGTNGSTSVPATRKFTSVGAGFDTLVRPGDMLRLTGNGNADAGDYMITSVVDPDNILVDRDWPSGSEVGVSFTAHIWVPPADPIAGVLLRHMAAYKSWGTALALEASRP